MQSQTFDDFDVIFVDDCSKDASREIIKDFAKNDHRLKLLCQSQNSGCCAARNAGIRAATGKTICFVDPDDILPENSLGSRYAAFEKFNTVVRGCYEEYDSSGNLVHTVERPDMPDVFSPSAVMRKIGVSALVSGHWTWLYPAELLQSRKIYFIENVKVSDDITFLIDIIFNITQMAWVPDIVYHWCKREESLSNRVFTSEHFNDYFKSVEYFCELSRINNRMGFCEVFCSEYASMYLTGLYKQLTTGRITEGDANLVIKNIHRICCKYDMYIEEESCEKSIDDLVGLQWIWNAIQYKSPQVLQRLIEGFKIAETQKKHGKLDSLKNLGWDGKLNFDALDRRQGIVRVRYCFHKDSPPDVRFTLDGEPQKFLSSKIMPMNNVNDKDILEHIFWLRVHCTEAIFKLVVGTEDFSCSCAEIFERFSPSQDTVNIYEL
jgi:glycosyltransferase involved in cell wall biosynthesis